MPVTKPPAAPVPKLSRGVCVEAAGASLRGILELPTAARGLVIFASNRSLGHIDSRQVALGRALNQRGLGTLLFDLVSEDDVRSAAGDVEMLTERLIGATEWSAKQWGVRDLPTGYVASGLGSAAALSAAAILREKVGAVASHWGRPDLATADLGEVCAPTLLVVDEGDPYLVAANARAAAQLRAPHRLQEIRVTGRPAGTWSATASICRWMEWHLGAPDLPYPAHLGSPVASPGSRSGLLISRR